MESESVFVTDDPLKFVTGQSTADEMHSMVTSILPGVPAFATALGCCVAAARCFGNSSVGSPVAWLRCCNNLFTGEIEVALISGYAFGRFTPSLPTGPTLSEETIRREVSVGTLACPGVWHSRSKSDTGNKSRHDEK